MRLYGTLSLEAAYLGNRSVGLDGLDDTKRPVVLQHGSRLVAELFEALLQRLLRVCTHTDWVLKVVCNRSSSVRALCVAYVAYR